MGKEARSLTAALNRTPEIEAFISSDTKQKSKVIAEATVPNSETEKPYSSDSHTKAKPASISADKQPRTERKQTTKPKPRMAAENTLLPQPRVPISTRVQMTTAKSLLKASYERKLAGLSPWSQQDIIKQAVLEWLAKHT